jgi:hypothetical protein
MKYVYVLLPKVGIMLGMMYGATLGGTAGYVPFLVLALSFYASFELGWVVLGYGLKKQSEDAYLYYLGVSGLRMLAFLASLGLTVFYGSGLRERQPILILTILFLFWTGVEVAAFLYKLRQISKEQIGK